MRRRGVRRLAASARVVVGTAGRATFFASGYGAEDAARALRRARELCGPRGERSLAFRLAMVLVRAPLVPGGAPGVRRRASIGAGLVARLDLNRSGPVLTPVVETSSRPPQAGLEGQVPLLLSPGALPPAGRLVWRSPVGSTGRGGLETRRSSVWLSRTIDDNSYANVWKQDGKAVVTAKVAVSKDGKTLTVSQAGTDSKGVAISSVAVYERQ